MSPLRRPKKVDFDSLYRRHAPSIYRYAFAVLGNQADAEDVTQQTFLNAYRAIAAGTKPRKPENWLVRIAHNELRRHFRTNGRALQVELDEELAQPAPERSEPTLADVLRALWQLQPAQRSALVLREFEGRSYAEIAELLGLTESALEALIFRARRDLAEHLEGALTCDGAEQALSRRLDGRLPRRESRRLKAHLHECARCVRFAELQKRQRSLLKGLSVMPIPASLFLFRGEQAAAAAGLGGAAAAGAGGAGVGTGLLAKAAAVTAAATVAGGVGYQAATGPGPAAASAERNVARVAAVAQPSENGATEISAATAPSAERVKTVRKAAVNPRRKAEKARARPLKPGKKEKRVVGIDGLKGKPSFVVVKTRPTKPKPTKSATHGTRTRRRGATAPGRTKAEKPKPAHPQHKAEKPKAPLPADPPPVPEDPGPGPKKKQDA
jgi:RNA polymerase sigma factor (sigma-70 family)